MAVTEKQLDKWKEVWGECDLDNDTDAKKKYTETDYRNFDRIYNFYKESYKGNTDPRIEYNLRRIAQLKWLQERAIKIGDMKTAKDIESMIKSTFDLEGMKANDSKPYETIKIDRLIVAGEKEGWIDNGLLKTRDEVIEALNAHTSKRKRSQSIDVVDEIIFAIINTTRANEGLSEFTELPKSAQIEDAQNELPKVQSKEEKKLFAELDIFPPRRQQ